MRLRVATPENSAAVAAILHASYPALMGGPYAALGFRRLGIVETMIGGVPFASVRMEKAI